jgi:hypothetical protein
MQMGFISMFEGYLNLNNYLLIFVHQNTHRSFVVYFYINGQLKHPFSQFLCVDICTFSQYSIHLNKYQKMNKQKHKTECCVDCFIRYASGGDSSLC